MELKDVLGEIEADGANLVHGRLLEWALTPPLWHADAVGGVHTIRPSRRAWGSHVEAQSGRPNHQRSAGGACGPSARQLDQGADLTGRRETPSYRPSSAVKSAR